MTEQPSILVCLTTVSDQDQARQLARQLIQRQLAACVQIDSPVESHYRWEGQDCCEVEHRLVIKTSLRLQSRLRGVLREIHPYQQPQIVTLQSVDVDPGYALWVDAQTAEG